MHVGSSYFFHDEQPTIPYRTLGFADTTLRLLGSDDFPPEVKATAARELTDTIEQAGLCRRQANPSDRRSPLLTPTPDGMPRFEQVNRTFERLLAGRLGDALSVQERQNLAVVLARLRSALASQREAHAR